jgi:hypothetical protein
MRKILVDPPWKKTKYADGAVSEGSELESSIGVLENGWKPGVPKKDMVLRHSLQFLIPDGEQAVAAPVQELMVLWDPVDVECMLINTASSQNVHSSQ